MEVFDGKEPLFIFPFNTFFDVPFTFILYSIKAFSKKWLNPDGHTTPLFTAAQFCDYSTQISLDIFVILSE